MTDITPASPSRSSRPGVWLRRDVVPSALRRSGRPPWAVSRTVVARVAVLSSSLGVSLFGGCFAAPRPAPVLIPVGVPYGPCPPMPCMPRCATEPLDAWTDEAASATALAAWSPLTSPISQAAKPAIPTSEAASSAPGQPNHGTGRPAGAAGRSADGRPDSLSPEEWFLATVAPSPTSTLAASGPVQPNDRLAVRPASETVAPTEAMAGAPWIVRGQGQTPQQARTERNSSARDDSGWIGGGPGAAPATAIDPFATGGEAAPPRRPAFTQLAQAPAGAQPYTPYYGGVPAEPAVGMSGVAPGGMGAQPGMGAAVTDPTFTPDFGASGLAAPNYGPGGAVVGVPDGQIPGAGPTLGLPANFADVDAFVEEARTGRFIIGAGINSEAGLTGQIVVDEKNFDLFAVPRSWQDVFEGRAFRGGGQTFRAEALPGTQVQRYLVSLTEPYLFDTDVSMSVSAFFFQRDFFDYDEQRFGGRLGFGYRLTPDLSASFALRAENIRIGDPRVAGVADLDRVLGNNDLYSGRATLTYDTRDTPFFPTDGQFAQIGVEQAFGDFDFPRVDLEYRRYYLLRERADGSGRHTLAISHRVGISGSDTPMFENYFAGGFSTLRGFDFRGASPVDNTVIVGGRFQFLGSVEYFFPLTADDMIKGTFFVDYGTVDRTVGLDWDEFRVAPGFGLRINIPALGSAPLALDLAAPVARAGTDDIQNFSFFIGVGRM